MNRSFDHVHIFTDNLEETITFYKNVLGAEELRRVEGDKKCLVHLTVGNARIVISPSNGEKVGIHHYALKVDNIKESIEELKSHGYKLDQTSINQAGEYKNVFIKDNNDILIELLHPGTE